MSLQPDPQSPKPQQPPKTPARSALLGLAEYRRMPNGRRRLHFRWGVIGLLAAALIVLLLALKTGYIYYAFRYQRGFTDMTVMQALTWPLNRTELRRRLGDYHFELAKRAVSEGDMASARLYLDNGLARKPDDLDGRLMRADFDRLMGRPELAVRRLREGLEWHGEDPEYLKQYIRILITERQDKELNDFAASRLTQLGQHEPGIPEKVIAYGAAQTLTLHGQFDTALRYLRDAGLESTPDGVALKGNILWLRGERGEAVSLLQGYVNQHPGAPAEPVFELLSRYLRETKRPADAMSFAILRTSHNPTSYAARLELIRCYKALDRKQRAVEEVEAYLRDFDGNESALMQLANLGADTGDLVMSRMAYERAAERGYNMGAFGMLYIEAHLVAREYAKAAQFCDQLQDEGPDWITRFAGQFNFLRTVAATALGQTEMAQLYRGRMMSERLQPGELISMARRYRTVGMDAEARDALQRAFTLDPDNEMALAGLIEVDLDNGDSGELITLTQELLPLRRPAYPLLSRLHERLTSDTFIFDPRRDGLLAELKKVLQEAAR